MRIYSTGEYFIQEFNNPALTRKNLYGQKCRRVKCQAIVQTGGRHCFWHRTEPTCKEKDCIFRCVSLRPRIQSEFCTKHRKLKNRIYCKEPDCLENRIETSEYCWIHDFINCTTE